MVNLGRLQQGVGQWLTVTNTLGCKKEGTEELLLLLGISVAEPDPGARSGGSVFKLPPGAGSGPINSELRILVRSRSLRILTIYQRFEEILEKVQYFIIINDLLPVLF
jgi:hypothetical protein